MEKIIIAVFGMSALFAPCAVSAADRGAVPARDPLEQQAQQEGCEKTQTNLNICSYYDYKVLDAELNADYAEQMSRLKGSPDAKRLVAAQRAWLQYIEADCLYQTGPREDSGTIWPLLHNNCLSAHLKQRIEQLKQFLACTQDGCPSAP